MTYASGTQVGVDRSRAEIERLLLRFGCEHFGYATTSTQAQIMFTYKTVPVRFEIDIPKQDDRRFVESPTGRDRTSAAAFRAWEQEIKRRWRALCLVIKALLVGIEDGVLKFEEAFLAHFVLGNNQTIAEQMLPRIERMLESGSMPQNLKQLEVLD